jgi:hypothetical protein
MSKRKKYKKPALKKYKCLQEITLCTCGRSTSCSCPFWDIGDGDPPGDCSCAYI